MMGNKFVIAMIIILVIIIGVQTYKLEKIESVSSSLTQEIISLEDKIDDLAIQKDSIRIVIDSTHVKIITNEKRYEEVVNTIISNPDSLNRIFTNDYIKRYIENIRRN